MSSFVGGFEIHISLNRVGYEQKDKEELAMSPIGDVYYPVVEFNDHVTASGQDLINLHLIFGIALTTATSVIIGKISSDLYEWSKKVLSKVLSKKQSFVDSSVILEFNNVKFVIYAMDRKTIIQTIEKTDIIISLLKERYLGNGDKLSIGINYVDDIERFL